MSKSLICWISSIGLFAATAALAEEPATAESPWRLGIALGYGERSNPLALSDDIRIGIDIDIAWFGQRWFFDNGDIGFTLLDREQATFNLVARVNSDRMFFSKTDSDYISVFDAQGAMTLQQVSVPDRDYALELGAELLTSGDWGYLQASVHRDVSATHRGAEVYLNVGREFRRQRWAFEPSLGASWKSNKLNDYYWGVRADEANAFFPAYRAGAGINAHARIVTSYLIDRRWTFLLIADYERLSTAVAASPIVEQRSVLGGFAGFRYGF